MTAALQRNLFTRRWRKLVAPQREDTSLHIPLVAMLRWCLRPDVLMRHVPNGEYRTLRTAQKLKAMGVLPGSADLEFHWREEDGRRRLLHLELKIGKRPMSIAQVEFALVMRLLGDEYHVARSIDEAITILGERGLIRPDVEVREALVTAVLHIGDCREVLRTLPDESVHCVVTSPPYFGLRDYGVDGQIGLEPTPDAYVAEMVAVFREVQRVLRKDGTLWLNLGDSYAGSGKYSASSPSNLNGSKQSTNMASAGLAMPVPPGLKAKDLIGIPWRVAFALQADGWYLRQDIIWSKPNPMPESVRDRCTKAHEYLFLLSKSERYYFDQDAIAETTEGRELFGNKRSKGFCDHRQDNERRDMSPNWLRNKRSVWEVATQPFSEAHFATFPPALIEPCILAGCPTGGTVLDPFGGAGTTGLVADRLQRNSILIELNPAYAAMSERRIENDAPLFAAVEVGTSPQPNLFDPEADFAGSLDEAYRAIRERKASGGPGWEPKEPKS